MNFAENMGARQLSPEPDSKASSGITDIVPKPRFAHTAVLLQGTTPGSLVSYTYPCQSTSRVDVIGKFALEQYFRQKPSSLLECSKFSITLEICHHLPDIQRHVPDWSRT